MRRTVLLLCAFALTLVLLGCGSSTTPIDVATTTVPPSGLDAALAGRTFASVSVTRDGQPAALVGGEPVVVSFPGDGTMSVRAACNTMSGDVSFAGPTLRLGSVASTLIGCETPAHEQDKWLATFLEGGPTAQLSGPRLVLDDRTTRIVLEERPGGS